MHFSIWIFVISVFFAHIVMKDDEGDEEEAELECIGSFPTTVVGIR